MKVKVGISNRHVHLCEKDFKQLFLDTPLEVDKMLNQEGEFKSNLVVSLEGKKGVIDNVRVLGPLRSYTQVEVSKTDCYTLGIDAPVRNSGDLSDASSIKIRNNDNIIERKCCIIATRHIHVTKEEKESLGLKDMCKVKASGEKGVILDNVYVKTNKNYNFELHLDTDDANSCLLKNGDYVEVIK